MQERVEGEVYVCVFGVFYVVFVMSGVCPGYVKDIAWQRDCVEQVMKVQEIFDLIKALAECNSHIVQIRAGQMQCFGN